MSRPPVIDLGRTETQVLEDRIRANAASIRRNWPHMFPDSAPGRRIGGGSRSAGILGDTSPPDITDTQGRPSWSADHTDTAGDVDAMTRLVSLRRHVTECLNATCRVIIEDRDITNTATIPNGMDTTAMCAFIERHAQWLGPQDYAQDIADELEDLAASVAAVADPPKRERYFLGRCPFVKVEREGRDLTSCTGRVYVQIGAWAEAGCDECEQVGPVAWWEQVLTLTPTWWVASGPQLARILAQRLAVTVDERTIRRWRASGRITAIEAFGPQPYAPRYDVRAVLDEVAIFDHECLMCGRAMNTASDLCLACLSTASTAKPRRRAKAG